MVENIKLDQRLMAIVELLGKTNTVVDVGCDHGYIPNYLIENKRAKLVYATDISKESLRKTVEFSLNRGNFDKIISFKGDGLLPIEGLHFNSVIIAGMGGDLIIQILNNSLNVLMDKVLILQPQTVVHKVREYLYRNGFIIEDEKVVLESGKFYEIMRAKYTDKNISVPDSFQFSSILLNRCDDTLLDYIETLAEETEKLIDSLENNDSERLNKRRRDLSGEYEYYKELLNVCKR